MSVALPMDTVYPRDAENRYWLVAVKGSRSNEKLDVLATAPDASSIGCALVTLHEDAKSIGRRLMDEGRIGILDVMPNGKPAPKGEWIILPWHRGET